MPRRPRTSNALPLSLVALASLGSALRADDDPNAPVTREEHDRVVEQLARVEDELAAIRRDRGLSFDAPDSPAGSPSKRDARLPGGKGGLYDKPFLELGETNIHIGGYFDVEYRNAQNARHDFRFHRLIPFIYGDIHERVRFATEIEIEDGEDLAVEFAYLDLLFIDQVNVRGGVILTPLGKFNLIHDSPINDLTDRPLVNQYVVPTTLREIGAGLFGTLTPQDSEWDVSYEAYLTSGFKGLDAMGAAAITSASGLRNARPHRDALGTGNFDDINSDFAGVGRLAVSPMLGSEVGVSGHSGTYDEAGDLDLSTVALDAHHTFPQFEIADVPVGPIELQGEGAYSFVERDDFARASGVAGDIWGYYVQANYHFMPQWLQNRAPAVFWQGSTFTFVTRFDQVNLDGNRMRRVTFGLNYRPIEGAVLKFDYQLNQGTGSAPDSADDDALLISLASYF